ncbi:hypothetical protein [Cellulomonas sp. NPDC089187]|uniref:hypothetical protein n=1 Tax=Cellulomonas sp. NPDC089187 TaxID=3154970 RepID=UPI00343E2233
MAEFDVDTSALDLVRQVAERQSTHVAALRSYLDSHTSLTDVGGAVMACLAGQYNEGRDAAKQGFDQATTVCDASADRMAETRQAYLDADRAAHERFSALAARLGVSLPAFHEPDTATLGSATADWSGSGWTVEAPMPPWSSSPTADGLLSIPMSATTSQQERFTGIAQPKPWTVGGAIGDVAKDDMTSRAWSAADNAFNVPTATSTLQQRYEQWQSGRYGAAYSAGAETTDMGWMTRDSDWARDRTGTRALGHLDTAVSTVQDLQSAWNAVEHLQETSNRDAAVQGVADGTANSATYDWAR